MGKRKQVFIIAALSLLLTACTSNSLTRQKGSTPLHLYDNPLGLDVMALLDGSHSYYDYALFVNYPNDLTKHGLRGNVAKVIYKINGVPNQKVNQVILHFSSQGKLLSIDYPPERGYKELVYENRRLTKIHDKENYANMSISVSLDEEIMRFEYEGERLVRQSGAKYDGHLTFDYYEDGKLKTVNAHHGGGYGRKLLIENIQFAPNGDLLQKTSSYAPVTLTSWVFMPYLSQPALNTYSHNHGLCDEIKSFAVVSRGSSDTLQCVSHYSYNHNDDLSHWDYQGAIYHGASASESTVEQVQFGVDYEYDYDEQGNWTTMRVLFPLNYAGSFTLRERAGYLAWFGQLSEEGERPMVTVSRRIEYHTPDTEEADGSQMKSLD
jgi:hypothetical protein